MVLMNPAAPDAGSRRAFLMRGVALAGALAIVGCDGTAPVRGSAEYWLEPVFGITGATLTDKVDSTG